MAKKLGALKLWLRLALDPRLSRQKKYAWLVEHQLEPAPVLQRLESCQIHLENSGLRAVEEGVTKILGWLEQSPQHHVLTLCDSDYPALLKEIGDPPLVLFAAAGDRAALQQLSDPCLAIVGSRTPTSLGLELAQHFASELSLQGCTIISGLARGIDGAAHQAVCDRGHPTFAVLGSGLAQVYPQEHAALAEAMIAAGGGLLSEYPPHLAPRAQHFPVRNRIISGLCLGVLVVEAASRSGTLITARLAAEQGREVFVLPGALSNPKAQGCFSLLKEGALLVTQSQDILETLPAQHQERLKALCLTRLTQTIPATFRSLNAEALPATCRTLWGLLEKGPCSIDELSVHSRLTPEGLSSILSLMELNGWIDVSAQGVCLVSR